MGINLKSTAVKVYPSAFRGLATGTKYNPEARLNTEFNVTNLTNRLASKDNFVIAWNSGAKIITFNIHGYYFETDLTEFLSVGGDGASWTNIYARIRLLPFLNDEGEPSAPNTKYKAFTLANVDDSTLPPSGKILDVTTSSIDTFFGVELSDSATPSLADTDYELPLLTRTAIPNTSPQEYTSWAVPLTSYLKFKATDVEGLPKINNDLTLDTSDTVFAPITVGTANQVLISAGVTNGVTNAPVWSGATIGSTTQPIYLNGGVITAITGSIANNTTGNAATVTIVNAGPTETNYVLFSGSEGGNSSPKIDLGFTYNGQLGVLSAPYFSGSFSGNVTGNVSGNAGTVTNGVYTTGNQTIGGTKTFSNTISGSVTGSATSLTTNAGSSTNPVHFSGGIPVASNSTVGSGTRPIFLNSGTITQSSSTVGSSTNPVFLSSGTITASNSTIGSGTRPVFLSAGTVTQSTSTVGSSSQPVYLNGGTITAITGSIANNTTGNAATVTIVNAGPTENNYVLFTGSQGGNSSPKIDLIFTYNGQEGVLFAPYFSGSLWNPVTFNNSGLGVASGTSYNAGTPTTISYNTLGAAASSHMHGNISNAGAIGSTSGLPIITTTSGVLTTGSFGTVAGTFAQGNHTHGNITNAGAIGSTADQVVVTGTNGVLTTQSRSGIDSRSTFTPSSHTHSASAIDSGTFAVARLPNVYSNIQTPTIVEVPSGGTALYTLPGGVSVNAGDVIRVEYSSTNTGRWVWAEVTLFSTPGPGAFPVLATEVFFPSGGLQTYRLAVQIGTSTTFDAASASSLTFRNGTVNGGNITFYVRTVQRKNY
jgi:hypothetical protein